MSQIVGWALFEGQFIDSIDQNLEMSSIDMGCTEFWPPLPCFTENKDMRHSTLCALYTPQGTQGLHLPARPKDGGRQEEG